MSVNKSIRVLDKDTINKIAAGEVVERPASIVKELVDNALDAGAANIRIELKDSGKKSISVRDDGVGMSRENLVLSPVKHATSKITSLSDLERISTMGFRGEALAAISSVSRFEIITKRKEDAGGTRLYLEDGKQTISDIGAPDGTTVTVFDLFYNTPARLKFLKGDATELSHIAAIVSDLILADPHISFTLINNGKTILSSPSSDLFNSVVDILGHDAARQLMPIPTYASKSDTKACDEIQKILADTGVQIEGFISKPSFTKTTPDHLFFIVNHRPVTSKELIKAVRLGYYTKIPNNRYPAAVLHLTIDPKEVDVNVHPRKIEVRFRDEKTLIRIITEVIETTLRLNELAFQVTSTDVKKVIDRPFSDFGQKGKIGNADESKKDAGTPSESKKDVDMQSKPKGDSDVIKSKSEKGIDFMQQKTGSAAVLAQEESSAYSDFKTGASSGSKSGYTAPPKDTEKRLKETERLLSASQKSPEKNARPSEISLLDDIRVVGQISNLYILVEKDSGLLIIDQHAAHERIFYDLLKKKENVSVQELISPAVVTLSPKEKVLMDEYIPYLEEAGFGISEFGDYSYAISFVPIVFGKMEDVSTIHEFIADLLSFGKIKDESGARETIAKRTACRAAIKAGACCNHAQIEELIRQLKCTENPYSCPHGRPTILVFSRKELEKMFERI
ncbi:MAG: DNA mismatch repair endonuclease MutL [Methanimicrococcus sp.]|nr:DNA mismatch repair endonuclease MutL [Methanimicrococcus sp.]